MLRFLIPFSYPFHVLSSAIRQSLDHIIDPCVILMQLLFIKCNQSTGYTVTVTVYQVSAAVIIAIE